MLRPCQVREAGPVPAFSFVRGAGLLLSPAPHEEMMTTAEEIKDWINEYGNERDALIVAIYQLNSFDEQITSLQLENIRLRNYLKKGFELINEYIDKVGYINKTGIIKRYLGQINSILGLHYYD